MNLELGFEAGQGCSLQHVPCGCSDSGKYDQYKIIISKQDFLPSGTVNAVSRIISTLQLWLKRQTACMII